MPRLPRVVGPPEPRLRLQVRVRLRLPLEGERVVFQLDFERFDGRLFVRCTTAPADVLALRDPEFVAGRGVGNERLKRIRRLLPVPAGATLLSMTLRHWPRSY